MGSTVHVVDIPEGGGSLESVCMEKKKNGDRVSVFLFLVSSVKEMKNEVDVRKCVHSLKVGVALVLVSLLYFLDPLYKEVGDDNAMWAIMTVVVIFEFYAGATLGKGLNRGMGTILGGALGCMTSTLGQQIGGIGNSIIVGIAVLSFGGAATYCRMKPSIKVRYDYGAMIFILTFSLVAVSGLRFEKVIELARERLLMIALGFVICIFISLFVFPTWASDELHHSFVSKFNSLASSIEGCHEEYFKVLKNEKEDKPITNFSKCKSVLNSKSKDESLANFAKWEPWHGKFGMSYPWDKYLKIGEILRELAATIFSLQASLQPAPTESMRNLRQSIKEPCLEVGSSLAWALKELGESLKKMKKCKAQILIVPKLKSARMQLTEVALICPSNAAEGLEIASFVFSLMEMLHKLEILAKEVDELGELACFKQCDQ
ncbi:aluminum-activated malate transporter 12-like [Mercurialis annua]|uniref:aluminum-activated malate transporter 12-like n=1 Tax=Mercurialis annua TaxID=3986 RepID=UPI00216016DA|nr:aluminum-activated malate transporter 12-like [Mercurialis annua]